MKLIQVALVLAAVAIGAQGRWVREAPEDENVNVILSVEEQEHPLSVQPFAPETLEPTQPRDDADVGALVTRARRSTTVFRPLFATRERDAQRQQQGERRRNYWAGEERRRNAPRPAPMYRPNPNPNPGYGYGYGR